MSWKLKTAELTEEQFNERDRIMCRYMSGGYAEFFGGVEHYTGLDLATLKLLIEKGYADPKDQQNCAPSIGEIVKVMERNPGLTAHGYWVSRERDDARISVEGVEGPLKPEFLPMFKHADDLQYDGETIYCWFD